MKVVVKNSLGDALEPASPSSACRGAKLNAVNGSCRAKSHGNGRKRKLKNENFNWAKKRPGKMNENRRDFLVKKCNSFRPAAFSKEYLFVFQFSLTAFVNGTVNAEREECSEVAGGIELVRLAKFLLRPLKLSMCESNAISYLAFMVGHRCAPHFSGSHNFVY
ncbi:MAG: hypothetical protein PHS62_03700 [Patescibacteria group bacterium]|nr:hypothetical protein [Patescibacteria group bacterium]